MKLILIPTLLLFGEISLLGQSPKMVDICELFSDMTRWNGELVQFEAKIERGGGEQGPWINALDCPTQVKIGEVEFGDVLLITNPRSPTRLHDAAFEFDPQSRALFAALLTKVDRRTEYIGGTVVGLFETKTPLSKLVIFTKAWPKGLPFGFGHLGGAPAQILVKTIADMRIEKKKGR